MCIFVTYHLDLNYEAMNKPIIYFVEVLTVILARRIYGNFEFVVIGNRSSLRSVSLIHNLCLLGLCFRQGDERIITDIKGECIKVL